MDGNHRKSAPQHQTNLFVIPPTGLKTNSNQLATVLSSKNSILVSGFCASLAILASENLWALDALRKPIKVNFKLILNLSCGISELVERNTPNNNSKQLTSLTRILKEAWIQTV